MRLTNGLLLMALLFLLLPGRGECSARAHETRETAAVAGVVRKAALFVPCPKMHFVQDNLSFAEIFIANPNTFCMDWVGALRGVSIFSGGSIIRGDLLPIVL